MIFARAGRIGRGGKGDVPQVRAGSGEMLEGLLGPVFYRGISINPFRLVAGACFPGRGYGGKGDGDQVFANFTGVITSSYKKVLYL